MSITVANKDDGTALPTHLTKPTPAKESEGSESEEGEEDDGQKRWSESDDTYSSECSDLVCIHFFHLVE